MVRLDDDLVFAPFALGVAIHEGLARFQEARELELWHIKAAPMQEHQINEASKVMETCSGSSDVDENAVAF